MRDQHKAFRFTTVFVNKLNELAECTTMTAVVERALAAELNDANAFMRTALTEIGHTVDSDKEETGGYFKKEAFREYNKHRDSHGLFTMEDALKAVKKTKRAYKGD